MTIGERIKTLREQHKLSQDQLAKLMGYKSRSTINKIELGKNDVSQSTIKKFATIFTVSPSELIAEDTEIEKNLCSEVHMLEQLQLHYGKEATELVNDFIHLNSEGQQKALTYLQDLLDMPKYRKEVEHDL